MNDLPSIEGTPPPFLPASYVTKTLGGNTSFDAGRGGTVESLLAYMQPAVLVFGIDIADDKLLVELSRDTGGTFEKLPPSWYNITTRAQSSELGAADRRLLQLLCTIPATATGEHAWVLRLRERP